MFTNVIAGKTAANAGVKIGAHQLVVRLLFALGADRFDDMPFVIHVVIRGGHDIGPMRFDIAEVADPRAAIGLRLLHEIHGPVGHVGGF